MEPAPGVKVTERVTLTEPLAKGAFGTVWRAEHSGLGIEVAVKFLVNDGAPMRKDAIKRFSIEASAAARIESPHVVRMFDHGVTPDGTPYLVMELMHGETLADRLKATHRLPISEAVIVVTQTAKALGAAHVLGVVHRDIKPSNLFLTHPHGETLVKVLDFGVAKQMQAPAAGSVITEPGMIIGTPAYLCRDVFVAKASLADPQVDLWALAVVAYRCLCDRLPFDGETISDVCAAIIKGEFKKPSELRRELDPEVDAWFARAFAADPKARFWNARDFGESFAALGQLRKKTSRWAAAAATLLGGMTALGALAVWWSMQHPRVQPAAPSATRVAPSASVVSMPTPPVSAASAAPKSAALPGKPRPGEIAVLGGQVELEKKPVWVDSFFIDQTEVTVLAYGKCVLGGGCTDRLVQVPIETHDPNLISADCNWHQTRREHHAMNCVTWSQADSFCRWAKARLPTEAEWMRAAGGDDGRTFPWGNEAPSCERTVMRDFEGPGCGRKTAWPVGTQPLDKSPLGVVDLGGNVREWVNGAATGSERVQKGGSWSDGAGFEISARHSMNPDDRSVAVGFRCARSPNG